MSVKIKDLRHGLKDFELVARIVTISDDPYARIRHKTALLEDETGRVVLNLWREQCNQCKPGDLVRITRGYAQIRNSQLQVSTWYDITVEKPKSDLGI